jgi:hypothetical protein
VQSGALAYGLKIDDRVRVLPNAKLRVSGALPFSRCTAVSSIALLASLPLSPANMPLSAPTASAQVMKQRSTLTALPPLLDAAGRMYTKAGQAVDQGTALAADLKIKPSADETARVRTRGSSCVQAAVLQGYQLDVSFLGWGLRQLEAPMPTAMACQC